MSSSLSVEEVICDFVQYFRSMYRRRSAEASGHGPSNSGIEMIDLLTLRSHGLCKVSKSYVLWSDSIVLGVCHTELLQDDDNSLM